MLHEARSEVYNFVHDQTQEATIAERIQRLDAAGVVAADGIYAALKSATHDELCQALAEELAKARRPKQRCCFFSQRR